MVKDRNEEIDILKGITIFLMIWGHIIVALSITDGYENNLCKFIYSFHMPLFMLISGYFFYGTVQRRKVKDIFLQRIIKLMIPIIVWGGIDWGVNVILGSYKDVSGRSLFYNWILEMLNIWFLWAIIICSFIVTVICKYVKEQRVQILIFVLIYPLLLILPDQVAWVYPFFILGFMYNKFSFMLSQQKKLLFCTSSLLFAIMLPYYNKYVYINITHINPFSSSVGWVKQMGIDIYRYIVAISGCIMIIGCVQQFSKVRNRIVRKWFNILKRIGLVSLQIYVSHGVLLAALIKMTTTGGFKSVINRNVFLFTYFWSFLISIFFVIILMLFIDFISFMKVDKILYGR